MWGGREGELRLLDLTVGYLGLFFSFIQDDMFNLLFDCHQHPERFQHMKPGDKYGTWSLVWNGQH